MSQKFPIISVTGSSGAGTTTVSSTFEHIFRREDINAAFIEGDAFHRYDRADDGEGHGGGSQGQQPLQPFRPRGEPASTSWERVSGYGETARARRGTTSTTRRKRRNTARPPEPSPSGRTCRRGTRPALLRRPARRRRYDKVTSRSYADLKIGVVPVINLEWTQKLHRDRAARATPRRPSRHDPAAHAGLRRTTSARSSRETDINFQRVPTVDTSNPFIARWIPTPDESMVVIRFTQPARHRLPLPPVDDPRIASCAAQTRSSSRAASSTSPCS